MGETESQSACAARLADRLAEARERLAASATRVGRDPSAILLMAVTKTVPPEILSLAYALGLRDFGENRVQEAREKIAQTAFPAARWELIGHLQSNKAARAVELFARVQSVDSLELARTLDARAAAAGRVLPILLEVNVAGEATKSGLAPAEVVNVARALSALPHLRPEGLMTVAPLTDDAERVRPVFAALRGLRDQLRQEEPIGEDGGWPHLSMGMSDDYPVAIEEGATIIRLGRALFGVRPASPRPVP